MLSAHVAVAKTPKYATGESGDTVEVVERAKGGISVILSDGQGSGRSAKTTSTMVVNKAVSLLADGARDGAVARAVHDYLYAIRHGKVSATLAIISVDLYTKTLLISRNSHTPVFILTNKEVKILTKEVSPIGVHRVMKPDISELPLEEGLIVVTFSDGILDAGKRTGQSNNLNDILGIIEGYRPEDTSFLTEALLGYATKLDGGRPGDDMAVVAVGIGDNPEESRVRKMSMNLPF
ncbi:MAG: PP2C family protein-serine/threonine phosphatase [Clostridia bacterium]|nr:PP2C family protein-serine/threonine phosphatase [Clostridia bacterium]